MLVNILTTIFISIITFAAAEKQQTVSSTADKCSKYLAGIVHQPENAGYRYLNLISEQIKCASPILWTASNVSFIESFEQKYDVDIVVYDAFGYVIFPEQIPAPPALLKSTNAQLDFVEPTIANNMFTMTAAANMHRGGYARDTAVEVLMYEFIVFNENGELKYIQVRLNAVDAPIIKK